eukprot:6198028-Pleurochrysis_carterae.AAC.3
MPGLLPAKTTIWMQQLRVVYKVSSNVNDHAGQINESSVRGSENQVVPGLSGHGSSALTGAI